MSDNAAAIDEEEDGQARGDDVQTHHHTATSQSRRPGRHHHVSVFEAALCRLGRGAYTPARVLEAQAAARDLGVYDSPQRRSIDKGSGVSTPAESVHADARGGCSGPSRVRRPGSGSGGAPASRRALFAKALAPVEVAQGSGGAAFDAKAADAQPSRALCAVLLSPSSRLPDPAARPVSLGAGAKLAVAGGPGLEMLLSPSKPRVGDMLAFERGAQRAEPGASRLPGALGVAGGAAMGARGSSRRRLEY